MNVSLTSILNSSTMLDGYRFDREFFKPQHVWTRSLISGAIATGITVIGAYSCYQSANAQFASLLGDAAINFKLAGGALLASLLGYSLRDLFQSVTRDVKTQMRISRAYSWLQKGSANVEGLGACVHMQQVALCMVRHVETHGGIRVFAVGKLPEDGRPVLIEAQLQDEEYLAHATYYFHEDDIRSHLNEACAEWSEQVAKSIGLSLDLRPLAKAQAPHQPRTQAVTASQDVEEAFDVSALGDIDLDDALTFGRASKQAVGNRLAQLKAATTVPADTVPH